MIEKSKIIELLRLEGYPEFMHEKTVAKIQNFQDIIAIEFTNWVEKNASPEISIEGYSYSFLVNHMNMQPIGAFITLDWLLRDPQKAKAALLKGIK